MQMLIKIDNVVCSFSEQMKACFRVWCSVMAFLLLAHLRSPQCPSLPCIYLSLSLKSPKLQFFLTRK